CQTGCTVPVAPQGVQSDHTPQALSAHPAQAFVEDLTMWKTTAGSTGRLLQLCLCYFGFYVLTGIAVKYFTALRHPVITDIAYLFNNTLGGSAFALAVVIALGWFAFKSNRRVRVGRLSIPSEVAYIIPSGICT